MNFLDEFLPEISREAIDLVGVDVTIESVTPADYDPISGARLTSTTSGSFRSAPPYPYTKRLSGGIVDTQTRFLLAADLAPFVPPHGASIVFNTRILTIAAVETVYSGTLPCLYIVDAS